MSHYESTTNVGRNEVKKFAILAGVLAGGVAIGYFLGLKFAFRRARCNHRIKLDADKIVDTFDVEDLSGKKVFCRCWHSTKFPYCDGSHNKHNKNTGDNVGPLIINKVEAEPIPKVV